MHDGADYREMAMPHRQVKKSAYVKTGNNNNGHD
jgi:hypothetical protein